MRWCCPRYMMTLSWPVFMRLYVPMFKWVNKDAAGLPAEQLRAVRTSTRNIARCLWTLSFAVGELAAYIFITYGSHHRRTLCMLPSAGSGHIKIGYQRCYGAQQAFESRRSRLT